MKAKLLSGYFTKAEKTLWCASMALIAASFCIFDRTNYLTLTASFVGVTSLIFCAKGNPFGQLLMIVFSAIYGGYFPARRLLRRNDHIPWDDGSHGGFRPRFLAAESLHRQPGRGCRQPSESAGADSCSSTDCRCYRCFLLDSQGISYGQPGTKHNFCCHKLSCRIPHIPAQRIFCPCVRSQRSCTDRFMGNGIRCGFVLYFGR